MAQGIRKAGVKKIVALTHGHEVWWAKLWPFNGAIRYIGARVDHLTYLGEFTRQEISRALSSGARDTMVKIAPGIDTEHFAPQASAEDLRASLGLRDKKVIVSVGRLVHRKGQDSLIAALPEILQRHPLAHILMVGEGPYRDHLEKLVKDLISSFHAETGSEVAKDLMSNWDENKKRISMVMPRDYARVLAAMERAEREGLPVDKVVMEAING
jgi:phosphatidylinositol alpha-1,6-mannosyltransferase